MLVDFITVRCALKPEMWYFCCPDDNILHSGADTFFIDILLPMCSN